MIYCDILYKLSFSEQRKNMNTWYEQEKDIIKQPQVISRNLWICLEHLTPSFLSVSLWITKDKQKQITKNYKVQVGLPGSHYYHVLGEPAK